MTNEEADRIVKAVLEGAERPASVDAALWESTCSLYARLMAMSDEERGELLSEVFATRH
jgi:hypothetical protein